jgi:hypothetical protein
MLHFRLFRKSAMSSFNTENSHGDSVAANIDVPETPRTDEEIAKLPVFDLGEFLSDAGVSPCFAPCGEPACQKLGCVRVYNARHRND